jgi:hypothetical protein
MRNGNSSRSQQHNSARRGANGNPNAQPAGGAHSPYDQTTGRINTPPANPGNTPDTDSSDMSELMHSEHENAVFNEVEELFFAYDRSFPAQGDDKTLAQKPESEYIRLFDPAVSEAMQLQTREFTSEELASMDTASDPRLTSLAEARTRLDAASGQKRWTMDGPTRRAAKKERQQAQDVFNLQRDAYLSQESIDTDRLDNLGKLTLSRSRLAEQIVIGRQGDLTNSKLKNQDELSAALAAYQDDRSKYFDEILARFGSNMTDEEKDQLASSFSSHEDGALSGEEAQHYLTEINDDSKKSLIQKATEKYNRLSWKGKIATGLGAAAVTGLALGVVGGVAAVAGLYSTRFARTYFNTEAGRRGKNGETIAQQQAATVYAGNFETSRKVYEEIANDTYADDTERLEAFDNRSIDHLENYGTAIDEDRVQETKDKRWALGKAVGITATSIVLAEIVEHTGIIDRVTDKLQDWLSSHKASISSNGGIHQPGEHNTGGTHTPDTGSHSPTPEHPAPAPTEVVPQISPEMQYTYGPYAGHSMNIQVPQGSSLWEQLDKDLTKRNPLMTLGERDRIIDGVLDELAKQHPEIPNIDKIPAGSYSVNLK